MTPEEAQFTADLRVRILSNVQEGKPAEHGITAEDLAKAIAFISGPRQVAVGRAKAAATKKKAAKGEVQAVAPTSGKAKALFDLLGKV